VANRKLTAKEIKKILDEYLRDTAPDASKSEQEKIIARLFDIKRPEAQTLLAGIQLPAQHLMEKIAIEFEINEQ
jgi:hypothetical protein